MVSRMTALNSRTGKRCRLQKKGMPRINPISSGGSPIGVRQPPILEIRKMKNTMMWLLRFLQAFILMTGRTISILAPVVPIQLDSMVPIRRSPTLMRGDPARSPSRVILPDTQNRPNSRMIKVR